MNFHQWRKTINTFNKSFEGNNCQAEEWNRNTIDNLPIFNKSNSIWNLQDKYLEDNERAMVLVGSSPCLAEDVDKLKELDENFMIICANSSLRFLLKHGIRPQYVICLDSDVIDIPQHLDCDSTDITLLASSVVCRKAIDNWKGPIWFMPYYSINKDLRRKLRGKLGRKVMGGGNSITQALVVATIIFGSKTVIFVGNEYCLDKSYYADPEAAKQEVLKVLYPVVDVMGRERWTLPALYVYAIWTEKICGDLTPPGFFIDTSFGLLGKDTNAIHNMELGEAIKRVKWAFEQKNLIKQAPNESEKFKILAEISKVTDDNGEVRRYDMQSQRERILQLARS